MGIVTGKDARVYIASGANTEAAYNSQSWYALSDFGLTFTRGQVEQPLVGETGNYFAPGALSVDGTYTNCRFAVSGGNVNDDILSIVNGKNLKVSGNNGSTFKWYFASCQVTGFDVKYGDADTITTASISFVVMDPFMVVFDPTRGTFSDAV